MAGAASPAPQVFDLALIGGGIVGVATAMALQRTYPGASLVLLEKEPRLALHQTGHNSGVIHSGLYYRPGSLKAKNCVEGRQALYRFCRDQGVEVEQCGKVVVATAKEQLSQLDELERRGKANGLEGIERLDAQELREIEPHVAGLAGLRVPETGIVDFARVTEAMADLVRRQGGEVRLGSRVTAIAATAHGVELSTSRGRVRCRHAVNCAGLHSDRLARMDGVRLEVQIVPFRGEYYRLGRQGERLVRHLIYPVPDPSFPFLGVHFTRMIDGRIEAGPNAVLALSREGYSRWDVSLGDLAELAAFPGFWRMARRYWRKGLIEYSRSFSKRLFVRDLRKLVPEIGLDELAEGGAGVRAQAVRRDGSLLDDFHIERGERMIHVLNAPSPAATASLSIGRAIAEMAQESFSF